MNCSICDNKAHHKHHIISKSKGGTNDKFNLTLVCGTCHAEIHLGNIVIEGNFLTTNGYKCIWHKKENNSITNFNPEVYLVGKK